MWNRCLFENRGMVRQQDEEVEEQEELVVGIRIWDWCGCCLLFEVWRRKRVLVLFFFWSGGEPLIVGNKKK